MSERVEIGRICEKGNGHSSFEGESDHGTCGNHYVGTIYVSVEYERDSTREVDYSARNAAQEIADAMRDSENHAWCNYDEEKK